MHSPDVNLAMFPEWFAAPQPDWPPHTYTIGFPLEDLKGRIPIPPELDAWLREGAKPVLLSPGSGNVQAREFFESGIAACERLGVRALLGTRFPEQLPHPLPSHVRHFDYLPFSELLPRVSVLVHHGGIGTLSQALAAGVPQLIMPMGHDQPDNARRVSQLGAGDALQPARFNPERVAARLQYLVDSQEVAAACARAAALCRDASPALQAVNALEEAITMRP
jgi:UDP:flavonoid glycosyltransferase YjiC (YdhE family)